MAVTIRKWATFVEELHEEGGKKLARPLRRVAVAVVVKNPYAGTNPDDLTELIDFGEFLGEELTRRAKEALRTPVEAYGKGGIVAWGGPVLAQGVPDQTLGGPTAQTVRKLIAGRPPACGQPWPGSDQRRRQ